MIDISEMTIQQAGDAIVGKLVEQGAQCMDGDNCVYSDGRGNHCSIGWVLLYDEDENGVPFDAFVNVCRLMEDNPEALPQLVLDNIDFFSKLQSFHDFHAAQGREDCRIGMIDSYNVGTSEVWKKWVKLGNP